MQGGLIMDSCQDIETIDCELSVYRKGFLSVRIDLAKGLIIWKDSNHWSNNFIRSLTFGELEHIRRILPELYLGKAACSCSYDAFQRERPRHPILIGEDSVKAAPSTIGNCNWQMILSRQDQHWCLQGHNPLAESWQKLTRAIEKISRLPVRL